jgi:ankyrin repeat protein
MRLLVANGADPDLTSSNGSTPLMVAAGMGWLENETLATEPDYLKALEVCIELGASLDAENTTGSTAIHGAVPAGFNKVIQRLADAGANVNLKNKRGQTPLKVALGYGAADGTHERQDTADLLRKFGAQE